MIFEDWGLVDYSASFQRQLDLVEEISKGAPERIIFCTHPPVVTLGRGSKPDDLVGWSGEIVEINRGGKATYHGPSQIVIYPLLDLTKERPGIPARDIAAYLRGLESWLIAGLREVGLEGHAVTTPKSEDGKASEKSFTGVWIEDRKIASIGIAVKKWITHHGAALNLVPDRQAFTGINPCGFQTQVMTNVERELEGRGAGSVGFGSVNAGSDKAGATATGYESVKAALIRTSPWE